MIEDFIEQFTEKKIGYTKIGDKLYLLDEELKKITGKTNSRFFSAGIYLGEIKNKKFMPSLALLEILAKHSDKKVFVDEKAEWLFLCGRDIFDKAIVKQNVNSGLILVQNEKDENLGYGEIVNKKNIAVRNILDRGSFLRRERTK